jgi:hypothetical protein
MGAKTDMAVYKEIECNCIREGKRWYWLVLILGGDFKEAPSFIGKEDKSDYRIRSYSLRGLYTYICL